MLRKFVVLLNFMIFHLINAHELFLAKIFIKHFRNVSRDSEMDLTVRKSENEFHLIGNVRKWIGNSMEMVLNKIGSETNRERIQYELARIINVTAMNRIRKAALWNIYEFALIENYLHRERIRYVLDIERIRVYESKSVQNWINLYFFINEVMNFIKSISNSLDVDFIE